MSRLLSRAAYAAAGPLAFALVALPVVWALDPFHLLRRVFFLDQLILIELGIAMALSFWGAPRGKVDEAGAANLLTGFFALALCLWTAIRFETFGFAVVSLGLEPVVLSALLILLTLECSRRETGMAMTLLVVAFVLYGFIAQFLPGPLSAPAVSLDNYATYLAIGGDALIGQSLVILATMVMIFMLFGKLFEFAGGSEYVKDLTLRFTSASRGAPIKVAVISSGLLGSIVGSTTSNILTTGSFTIPMMRKIGLPAHKAAAIEAVASTGGQLTPPVMGAAAFLMADIAGLPYGEVMFAAIVPSLLYYFSLFVQADRMAVRYRLGGTPIVDDRPASYYLRRGAVYLIPVFVIVACLAEYEYAPDWAGVMGSVSIAAVALWYHRRSPRLLADLTRAVIGAGKSGVMLVITGASVGIMLGVINSTGLGVSFAVAISQAALQNLFLALLIAALAAYVLGTGLATTAVYVLAGTLVAPSLVDLGISTMGAHLFVFYAAMLSMITPPIAIACLVACGLAGAPFLKTSNAAMQFGWIKFVLPFLFVYSPELLLDGEPQDIVAVVIATVTAIVLVASASAGYERERLSAGLRLAYLAYAIVLIVPVVPLHYRLLLAIPAILWINRHRLKQLARRAPVTREKPL